MALLHFLTVLVVLSTSTGQRTNTTFRRLGFYEQLTTASPPPAEELNVCWVWEDDSYFGKYDRIAAAVDLGIQHANYLLPDGLRLKLIYQSSGSSCAKRMYTAVDNVASLLFEKGVQCHVFLGAGCAYTAAALYGFAHKQNVPILGCPAVGSWAVQPDSDVGDFPLTVMLAFGYSDTANFLSAFLDRQGYEQLTIFRDDSYAFYPVLSDSIMRYIKQKKPMFPVNAVIMPFESKRATDETYKALLTTANQRSRVFVMLLHGESIRQMMLVASKMELTNGDHLYIAFELYDNPYWGKVQPLRGDEKDQVAVNAYESLLVVSFDDETTESEGSEYSDLLDRLIKDKAKKSYNYTYKTLEKVDPVVLGHYESLMVYAQTIQTLHGQQEDFKNGSSVVELMKNNVFDGIRGPIHVSRSGERDRSYNIRYYNKEAHKFETYINFRQHSGGNETFRVVREIVWPGETGRLPPNEPECGFLADKCKTTGLSATILGVSISLPLLLIGLLAMGLALYYRKARIIYNPNWWRIPVEELSIKGQRNRSNSSNSKAAESQATTKTTSSHSSYVCDILATFKGEKVSLIDVQEMNRPVGKELIDELLLLKSIDNANHQKVFGIAIDQFNICQYIVTELCPKGSLSYVLENDVIQLDWLFKNSLIRDLVNGMTYLHSSVIGSHGNLSSDTCVIDMRFALKIADYGLPYFRPKSFLEPPRFGEDNAERNLHPLLWRAPELLRTVMPPNGTQKGDVYSFAIMLQQLILRSGPFELPGEMLELTPNEIIQEVRPRVPRSACSNELYDLMERCWGEFPLERPTFQKIKEGLRRVIGEQGENIVDQLLKRMDQYATNLEQKVADQTQQFIEEKNRADQLLQQLLPKTVAASLIRGEQVEPEAYESATIYFSDIVGFTTISSKLAPMDVVALLNGLYTYFDNILDMFDVYKVETIGDSYMVCSGLPQRNGNKHVSEIAHMALRLLRNISSFEVPKNPNQRIQIRSGINSGPCVAGIVGLKMPRYCLFGDTVNVASRMESTGEPGKVQITADTRALLLSLGDFETIERGATQVKGKGTMVTYWLM